MSAAAGSGKASQVHTEEEALYDAYVGFVIPEAFTEIPWPEWNDAELNAEAWDEGKAGKSATTAGAKKELPAPPSSFDDTAAPALPLLIRDSVCSWKRPGEVFENSVLTVYDTMKSDFELIIPSAAADCDFFKAFNEQLPVLQCYALKYGFSVELEGPKFVPTTQGETWRPWHHVYALCKAGKGQVHKPLYCPYGKYVVRLFYMGAWRKITVDDKIPCDTDGMCMLPTTTVPGELWPIILTKALLKIASLTPSYDFLSTDFPLLSFFTGWAQGSFTAANKTDDQIWRRLNALIPSYKLPGEGGETDARSTAGSAKNAASKKESKRESRPTTEKKEFQNEKFCFLLAATEGFSEGETLLDDYAIAITMTRDIPLEKVNKRESTKLWKRIRWVHWAKEKGLWTDERLMPPYRRLQIISFVRELIVWLAPDPKQDSVLYDIPPEEESEKADSYDESRVFEPEQWCDYLKFRRHLSRMYVYFKPSYFNYTYKITSLKERTVEGPASAKSAGKATLPSNFFSYPPVLKPTCNEPLFVFCESLEGILLCISLSVSPKNSKELVGYLEADHPEVLKVGHAALIAERFSWKTSNQGEILGLVKTVGNSSLILNLKPGRHLLKLWLCSDSPYVIDVYSNVNVIVHKYSKIRISMTIESNRISNYVSNVSNAFIALTQKFGKPDLPHALHEFYNSIRPGNDGMIGYYRKIDDYIETFLNCLMLSLKDLISNTDELKIMMWALQSLFFNPNIRCDLPSGGPPSSIYGGVKKPPVKKVIPIISERTLSEILEYPWTPKEINQIVLIQRIFRGFRVRLLWKYQTPSRKEFKPYIERLKKICDTLFVPPKREQEVGYLLRRIAMARWDLLPAFKFHEDFYNVVQFEEYTGKLANVEPFAWVPLTRFVVACHSDYLVPCAFYFSCNLENFVIQCFDNDTNQEIFRLTNQVSPHYFQKNVRGYTIFAFGWNEANFKNVNWKLEMMRMKYLMAVHLCNILLDFTCHPYVMPNLEVMEVKNFYIPNSKNRICRCFIKIQKRTLLTLRFSTSYCQVHFFATIALDKNFYASGSEICASDGVIMKIASTNGAVLVPSLVLEFVESPWWTESYADTEPTVYVVEVFVIDKSWPLTKQEWGVVEPLRVNGECWKDSTTSLQSKRGGSDSRKKSTRLYRRSVCEQKCADNPLWLLQVLNDSGGVESGESIVVEEDKSHLESIRAMKLSWEEKDPGRRKRGREMRAAFLRAVFLEDRKNECGEEDVYLGEYEGERGSDDIQLMIDRMSSFTYLTNDTSPTRYITSPRTLPVVPLFQLLCKYCRVKESATEISEDSELAADMSDMTAKTLKNLFEDLDDEMKDFLNQCVHFRSVMVSHTNEELRLSNKLMEQAYEGRAKAIERMMR